MTHSKGATARRSLMAVAGVAAASLALAACGSSSSSSESSSAPGPSAAPASSAAASAAPASSAAASAAPASAAAAGDPAATLAALTGPIAWPEATPLGAPVDIKGKTVWWVPIGDAIPVIHGIGVGLQQAVEAAGGTFKLCDGKFNPNDIGNCLKTAGDQGAAAVVTAYIDYAMLPNAFDALTAKDIPVLVAGVPPTGGKTSDASLAFFDPTGRVNSLYDLISTEGVVAGGDAPNGLWLRLLDSSLTTAASDEGMAKFKELCPDCALASVDFTTANVDKLASAVSAALVSNPDVNVIMVPVDSFVPPVQQALKTAGVEDKIKVVSASGDLANLQMVKDGKQAGDAGTPVIYTGWGIGNALMQMLAGDTVAPDSELITRYFDASNVGDLQLTPEAYLTNAWYGDDSYQDKFLAAWGVK